MRFALVVEAPKEGALDRLAPVRDTIARAGFNIVRLRAGAELTRDLARAMGAMEEGDAALVYVATDVRLDGQKVVLVGDGVAPLADVAAIAAGRKLGELLFVFDARCQGDRGDALHAADHVEGVVRDVAARERGAELLVAVESGPLDTPPSFALSRFFGAALAEPSALAADGTMRMSTAWARMRSHPEFSVSVPSFAHVKGGGDFLVVAPTVERASDAPPPVSRGSALPSSVRSSRRTTVVMLPALQPILVEADRALGREAWDEALDGYKKALMIAGDADAGVMASLYASVAEVKLAQGKTREAEASFEKALIADPAHGRSLAALAKMAVDAKEWGRAAQFERKVARGKGTDEGRIEGLLHVAARYANDAKDPARASEVLDEARAIKPTEPRVLEASRVVYAAMRQWKKMADVLGSMADAEPLLHDKAQRRFEQADVILGRLREEGAGIAALEAALEDDPTHEKSLAALVAVRTRRQEWRELEGLYARMVERFAQREDAQRAWEIVKRLGQVRRDKLVDGPGALEAFTAAVRLKPKDVETRAALAELLVAKGDREGAIVELETCARFEPLRAETHRRLCDLHRKLGHTDRAWLAATALEELKATDVDQQVLADQFRGDAPRPTALLESADWELVRAPGHDPVVEAVLAAIAPVAAATKVALLRERGQLTALDPARRQPPESTATVVRTFAWAAKVLRIDSPPELYAHDHVTGGLAAVPLVAPTTVLGPSVMSGRKLSELAFLVARHLVYYRPEHYALLFYPSLNELSTLVLAAVKLARPELPVPAHAAVAAGALRKELAAHASEAQKAALVAAVEQVEATGGKMELASWIRGVELTATRAGLLLSGDLATAIATMRNERRAVGDLELEDRRADLLAFTESRALAEARARLGLAAKGSVPPPPSSAARLPAT